MPRLPPKYEFPDATLRAKEVPIVTLDPGLGAPSIYIDAAFV
jgi:hypothetical protein